MSATFSALFIDDQYLKDYTPLGKNLDSDEIYPFVQESQDMFIQDVLGTPLYDDLVWKLYSGITYSTIERNLVDVCSKALAYWTVYLALPHLSIKIRNIGVARTSGEYTQQSTMEELKYLREETKNLAEWWNTRIVSFLCQYSEQFPLYNAATDGIYPTINQYDSDFYIEDKYKDLTYEEIKFLKKYLS